ncbi:MAG: hypothetical protein ACD_22C00092G0004 [uncultured bacterium]|nr:MAG: hypothetical protein ACD_22C00092G0004 [uncultured bacterium]
MIDISTNFNEKPSFEILKNRKPIMDYTVSIFRQFDFNTWESEENITVVRVNKSNVTNAEEFLKNITSLLNKNIDTSKIQQMVSTALDEIIRNMVHDFKYDLKLSEGFVDAVQLENEWDYIEVLIETNSEFVYIQWNTTA